MMVFISNLYFTTITTNTAAAIFFCSFYWQNEKLEKANTLSFGWTLGGVLINRLYYALGYDILHIVITPHKYFYIHRMQPMAFSIVV